MLPEGTVHNIGWKFPDELEWEKVLDNDNKCNRTILNLR